MDHTRRGGGRVVRGGDACVAPRGGRGNEAASEALPHNTYPRKRGGVPHKRELKEPGRPQGIAPTIRRIGLASPCIVGATLAVALVEGLKLTLMGAIPCGRP